MAKTLRFAGGSGRVVVVNETSGGGFSSRLWVNGGETATLVTAKAKTLKGATKQAERMLGR